MRKQYKNRYRSLEGRPWGSLEAHEKTKREQSARAWAAANKNLPDNAFGDNDPNADEDVHRKYYPQPTMVLGYAGSSEDG